jgi:outer membrane protein assembly factor BamE (lipoprotein component of BamABCDE complex)
MVRIKPGMTRADVVERLGPPMSAHRYSDGAIYWLYPDGFHDPRIIEFDVNGQVRDVR